MLGFKHLAKWGLSKAVLCMNVHAMVKEYLHQLKLQIVRRQVQWGLLVLVLRIQFCTTLY